MPEADWLSLHDNRQVHSWVDHAIQVIGACHVKWSDLDTSLFDLQIIDARSPVAGKGGDAGDHGPPHDVEHDGIVSFHLSPLVAFRNPRRPS